jgi:hypothetical protein
MTISKLMARATFLAMACLAGGPGIADAQQAAGAPPGGAPPGGAPSYVPAVEGQPWPVIWVTSIELLRSEHFGGEDIVRARALVTSEGWSTPQLVPLKRGEVLDGVLDLVFQANAPAGAAPLGKFMVVHALLPLGQGHPYKSIRVRSGTNAVTLKSLPGFVSEAGTVKDDCSKCLGKYFVAKGATPPAGVAAGDVLREEDVAWSLRVIRPRDGIASYAFDPNRLTLMLSDDGRITNAVWN